MSIARHHNEWLSLVPVSGPFLSMSVLMRVFPQGLGGHESEHFRTLRLAYEEWSEWKNDPAIHKAWIKFVLGNTLELPDEVIDEGQAVMLQATIPAHRETLRPDYIIKNPAGLENAGKPRLLICTYPPSQNLERPVANCRWKASPDTRMTELLHRTNCRIGLVTNGEHWMLVDAPTGETSGYISWYANLWLDENITLRAFRSLLDVRRFFSVPDEDTLETMLTESAANQQEVTDQLGYQVRNAVEVLVQSLDRADQDRGGTLLKDITEEELYEAALTVMMRLVFLFSAEERELLPLDDPLYNQNYAVSTLRSSLRETADQQTEDVLERRRDAWSRLLSTFRSVYGGIQHERLNLPAYGGHLLDPDRFPFLEGRASGTEWRDTPATPLPVNNRTVLHLLEALQILQVKVPGGGHAEARLLSFRSLDIEQIGHVYEGLLDHTAKRASETFLGFAGGKDKEPEISISALEELRAKGDKALVEFLKKETGRTANPLKKALTEPYTFEYANRCRIACGNDVLWKRVEPYAALVRSDTFGRPVIIREGSVYVTAGTDRRSSGTHYTPTSLTQPIVKHTLDPLCYVGPAEGTPESEWKLRSARELLELKICDMACGSGAFLVQVCRYLSELLVEAWEQAEKELPGRVRITPHGNPSEGVPSDQPIPLDAGERLVYARRIIAARCLYGVDVNPLAVEMAKLSLWLLTLAKDKPFEFLDHAIRCGDSLVGLHDLEQLRYFSLKPASDDLVLFKGPLDSAVDEAVNLRLKLGNIPANAVEDVVVQEKLLAEAADNIARLRCAADLLVAGDFWGENTKDRQGRVGHAAVVSGQYVDNGSTDEFEQKAAKELRGQKTFHWPLEFPEVIVKRGGFDAFVGNPPILGGRRISLRLGRPYFTYLKSGMGESVATTDLCVYFLLKAFTLLSDQKYLGLLLSDVVSQGDSRENGLLRILKSGGTIFYAISTRHWPGTAGVKVAHVHLRVGEWNGAVTLDGQQVGKISSYLKEEGDIVGDPKTLIASEGICFTGHYLMGQGFVVSAAEADELVHANPASSDVIFPYIRGDDINNEPTQTTSNRAINFGILGLEEVQARYPECLQYVRDRVKPERDNVKDKSSREKWWRYARPRPQLYKSIENLDEVVVQPFTAKYLNFSYVSSRSVFAHPLVVVTEPSPGRFAVLLSCFHEAWVREYCSTSLDLMRYTASSVFDTFPFPPLDQLTDYGRNIRSFLDTLRTKDNQCLNDLYNRFHDPGETVGDMQKLRDLHVEIDNTVAGAYGWDDLDFGYGFNETRQGLRYAICESARREVLRRLLKLNHERYEEEVKQGLQDKENGKGKKTGTKRSRENTVPAGPSLFGDYDEDGG